MKKLLLLFLTLLLGVSASWATTHYFVTGPTQVTDLTTLSSSKYYILQNNGSSGYIKYDASSSKLIMSTSFDYNSVVQLNYDNTNVTIKQVCTNTYFQLFYDQDRVSLGASSANFTFNTNNCGTGLYRIANGSIYMNRDDADTYPKGHTGTGDYSKWKIYEVTIVEIADDACYKIDFISHDGTKTWGLKSGTTEKTAVENEDGDVYVAHSYTNLSGEERWVFVNNSDGTFLAYHGQATTGFNYFHAISEFKIEGIWEGKNTYMRSGADYSSKVCITNDKRYTNNTSLGTYILKETDGAYDNSAAPYYNNSGSDFFTSALKFTATGDKVSTAASNAISQFDDSYGPSYPFTTTNGAFFKNLTDNKAAGDGNYCNLWISKNTTGKPQVKLVSSNVGDDGKSGNNMRSSGGLYTTASNFTYNLSINEGRIISYTIVGTAVGALSITPAGGSAEAFAASASVNKTVVLASPAKQTSFTLTGSTQWLNVTGFAIQYETDATPVSSLSDIESNGIYTITCYTAERGGMYAGTTYLDACGGHANTNYPANKSMALDASDANQQFVIYTHGGNKYLYNIGRNKFVGVADGLYYKMTGAPINNWSVSDGTYDGYFRLTSQDDSKMATMNAWVATGSADSKDYAITGQSANENANNFALLRVGTLTSEQITAIEAIFTNYDALQTSLTSLGKYTVGSGLGEYTNALLVTNDAKETAITNIQNGLKDCAASDIPTANTQVQGLITGMTLNPLSPGNFLLIKTKHDTYLNGVATTGDYLGYLSCVSTPDNSSIFYYDSDNSLIDYGQGYKANGGSAGTVGGSSVPYTFVASTVGAPGTYAITFTESESTKYLTAYGEGYHLAVGEANEDVNGVFTLEKVTILPVTITSAHYATLYSPVALTIPAGVTAYIASDEGEYLHLTAIEGTTIPKNTGVILYSATPNSYDFEIAEDVEAIGGNALTGTVATISKPEGAYYLSNGARGIGFYKAGTVDETDVSTLAGFKAYLPAGGGGSVKAFVFDDETGIRSIDNEKMRNGENEMIFNLAGQRVAKAQKGLYIVNGKKVVIK